MKRRGIEFLHYHQVDNPTAIVCDPVFLGFHAQRDAEMSIKVVAKRSASERMGVAVDVSGRTQIIEYSDMPADVAAKTDDRGELLLWAGSTAIHVFSRLFLERVELKPSTPKSITEIPVLMREIAEVKRTGVAFDDGEFNTEVRCVAVPVTDFTGQVVGALGISGPIWRLSIQALQSRAITVQAAARRLSAEFGYR